MENIEELWKIIYDLLDDVDNYKHQVDVLRYDNSFLEFEFSRGQKNYERIIKKLQNVHIEEPIPLSAKNLDIEKFKYYVTTILRKILKDKYEDDIKIAKTFINPTTYSHPTDVATKYKDILGISTPYEFMMSSQLNYIQIAHVINSEIRVLLKPLYKNFSNTIGNIHYQKLPGIIATYVAIYELSNLLNNKEIISNFEDYYIYSDTQSAQNTGKDIINVLPEYRHKDLIEHKQHEQYSFIISDIYSTNLIEKYLEDEQTFLITYMKMIEGVISISDFLGYYGINLKEKNVTLKFLNKVEEVEKRQ